MIAKKAPVFIDTTLGRMELTKLAKRGGVGWTEYLYAGKVVRRDASAKLQPMKAIGTKIASLG